MNKRFETALEVLREGGYFRKALETNYHGVEKFVTRLYTADNKVVKGVSIKTFFELEDKGLLKFRPTPASSVWPTEHVLKETA